MMSDSSTKKVRLTNKFVDSLLKLPAEKRSRRYWDAEYSPLFLQFSATGSPSYVMRYTKANGNDGDFAIGSADYLSADAARGACKEHMSAWLLNGVDPVEARRASRAAAKAEKVDTTFKGVADAYLARKLKVREAKGKTRKLAEVDLLQRLIYPLIGSIDVDKINQSMIEEALEDIELGVVRRGHAAADDGRTTAVACHKAMKRVYKYAIAKELTTRNPAAFKCAEDTPVKRRGRMDDPRFRLMWDQLVEGVYRSPHSIAPLALLIYITTIQRPVDIARARRSEINLTTRTWRPTDTKTGTEYFVPLSDLACKLISIAMARSDSEWLFPKQRRGADGHMLETSMGNYWFVLRKRLVEEKVLEDDDINVYDCRRYGRTQIVHKLGYSRDVAELVINHHQKSGMDTLYDVHDYEPDIRRAQEAWSAEVVRICQVDVPALFTDFDR